MDLREYDYGNKRIFCTGLLLFVVWLGVVGILVSLTQCTMDIGQKPVLTMADVKQLAPKDLGNFAMSLYNKQAEWYKDRIARWDTLTKDQQEATKRDYKDLCTAWPIIDLYDAFVSAGQPVPDETRMALYGFIEKYLGGVSL